MTPTNPSIQGATPMWSRRPYVGTLPKVFRTALTPGEVLTRLKGLAEGPDTVGAVEGSFAWLRRRGGPPLPATTLRLTVAEESGGARVVCRFDPSPLDTLDLWIYSGAATIGFVVAGSWLSGHMPQLTRAKISEAIPVCLAALAVVTVTHSAFRRWRQAVRDRLFDQTMIAVGVPIA